MLQGITRIALIAALMVGVIAMHSFGHSGHSGEAHGQIVASGAHESGHGHMPPAMDEPEPDGAEPLTLLGLMVCGVLLARLTLEYLRSAWSRLWGRPVTIASPPAREAHPIRFPRPPPVEPTGLQLNRIALLLI